MTAALTASGGELFYNDDVLPTRHIDRRDLAALRHRADRRAAAVRQLPPSRGAPGLLTPIEKADVLIEAMGWIRQFRDKVTVIKLGGSVMEDADALRHLLIDIVFMETVGMRPVVVHGGGAAINRAMDAAGLEPRFIQGRRYTDDATRDIVEHVLAYETNEHIAERIEEFGGRAVPLELPHRPTCCSASG